MEDSDARLTSRIHPSARFAVGAAILALVGGLGWAGTGRVLGRSSANVAADRQTAAVTVAANAFLKTLTAEQREKVLFAFPAQTKATKASFHRTADGGVAPGAPVGHGGNAMPGVPTDGGRHAASPPVVHPDGGGPGGHSDGGPGDHSPGPGGPGGGFGMGPPGGFIGEQFGQAVWSNYPVGDVLRPGLRLGALSGPQREAAMHLLQVLLSPMGYSKVRDIMGSDQALADAGTNFASGEAVYTIALFGEPNDHKPWMLEFGGHHLGLNVVIAGARGIMTPTLTGAQPSVYRRNGQTVRVLAEENDSAFALLNTFSAEQKKAAILPYEVGDLVLGPGHAGEQIAPEGIKASELTGEQRTMLLGVIAKWAGIVNDAYAKPRLAELAAALPDTYFAWSGPTTHEPGKNGHSYYRIQGPRVLIEFSPQGVGGDPTMHVHTIYRDPTDDYGVHEGGAE